MNDINLILSHANIYKLLWIIGHIFAFDSALVRGKPLNSRLRNLASTQGTRNIVRPMVRNIFGYVEPFIGVGDECDTDVQTDRIAFSNITR